ncbi:Uncharacterized protein TCM_005688 [Theobroma cacao]|uniref:Uncharacterized protein n=1 Tax=Theobroma cacao TaxID=3641 RepID=A0A061DVJ8_THECC|nr:Uncharacterized protein TCM_005688 [Theobroma cacao]
MNLRKDERGSLDWFAWIRQEKWEFGFWTKSRVRAPLVRARSGARWGTVGCWWNPHRWPWRRMSGCRRGIGAWKRVSIGEASLKVGS